MDAAQRRAGHGQLGLRERAGNAEVSDLHPAAARHQHVRRLDVAVHDAASVGRLERLKNLLADPCGRRWLDGPVRDHLRQVATVDELHDDEGVAGLHAEVEYAHHVRMGKRGRSLRFLAEARHEGGVAAVLGAQDLDRDVTARAACRGRGRYAPYRPPEQFDDLIAAG